MDLLYQLFVIIGIFFLFSIGLILARINLQEKPKPKKNKRIDE